MLRAILATAVLCAVPCSAHALTVIATGVGVIEKAAPYATEPIDEFGLFGPRGVSVLGEIATITISVDLTATPPILYGDGTQSVRSGYYYSYPGDDPERTADIGGGSITINGIERLNDGSASSSYTLAAQNSSDCDFTTGCIYLSSSTGPGRLGGSDDLYLLVGGFSRRTPVDLLDVPTGGNICDRAAVCRGAFGFAIDETFYGAVRLTSLHFSVASVPEPATWAMMILGFGAIGYAMRRKTVLRSV